MSNSKTRSNYLSPTESSARKNINVEPFFDDTNFTSMTSEGDVTAENYATSHSPIKASERILTSDKIRSYSSSSKKSRTEKENPESNFTITKSTFFKQDESPTKTIGSGGIIQTTKLTTTTYSPDAKKVQVVHTNCSHRRKNCCSAKKLVQNLPSKTVKTRSTSYEFQDPDRIRIEFDTTDIMRVRKHKKDDLEQNFESAEFSQSRGLKAGREEMLKKTRVEENRFDVESSEHNTHLSTLILKRIEENKQINAKKDFMPTKAVPDLKQHIADLRRELEDKKNSIASLKQNTMDKNELFDKYKREARSGPDFHGDILFKKQQNLKEYISDLRRIKNSLKDYERQENVDPEYHGNFEKRHKDLVDKLDSNGIALNDQLTDLIAKDEGNEKKITQKVEEINSKIDERENIKQECRQVDKNVSKVSETASVDIHKLLQILAQLLKQKGELKGALEITDSDIVEYNAITCELEGHKNNAGILRQTNKRINKKHNMITYLDDSISRAEKGKRKTEKALEDAERHILPKIKISKGRPIFDEEIDDLRSELKKYKDLEAHLKGEIRARYGSLDNIPKTHEKDDQIRQSLQEQIDLLLEQRKENLEKLAETVEKLVKLGHVIFERNKEVKVLEGQILLYNFDALERMRIELTRILQELRDRLEELKNMPKRGDSDHLRIQIQQMDRKIVYLVNQLRNLDDKILYVKANSNRSPCKYPGCSYYTSNESHYRSAEKTSYKKSSYRCCSYHGNLYTGKSYVSRQNYSKSSLSQSYNSTNLKKALNDAKYRPFVPSADELKNLISEDMLHRVQKVDSTNFKIDYHKFNFLRDYNGNTYAQDATDTMPLYEFLERFKDSEMQGGRYHSPQHTTRIVRHIYNF